MVIFKKRKLDPNNPEDAERLDRQVSKELRISRFRAERAKNKKHFRERLRAAEQDAKIKARQKLIIARADRRAADIKRIPTVKQSVSEARQRTTRRLTKTSRRLRPIDTRPVFHSIKKKKKKRTTSQRGPFDFKMDFDLGF